MRLPLSDRGAESVLYWSADGAKSAGAFAGDAQRLAAVLPEGSFVVNLCRDRYAFTVGFAAALLRGQVSLLTSDRTPNRLHALAERFSGLYALTDEPAGGPLPEFAPGPFTGVAAPIPTIPGDQVAALVFTSGSTGEPVAHTKHWVTLVERSRDGGTVLGLDPARPAAIIGTVPPQHMYGFETTVLLPLHAPAATWCGPVFFPADIRAALAAAAAPRVLVTTPFQLRGLQQAAIALPPLWRIVSATAPLEASLADAAERLWTTPEAALEVWEIFGATEIGSVATRRTTAGEDWTAYPRVVFRNEADGLWVDAPGAAPTRLDDQLELQPGGRFRLLGRRTDVVKLGGHRASLAGLNSILTSIDGVQDGVFVPPDVKAPGAGDRMTAFVVAPGRSAEAILADLRTRIDPVFLPRRIVHVDRLPRNELGKLPLAALQGVS
jgi:acyl-coenzyme A synthetase/AMP-(fatty) acid ligase